MVLPQPKMVEFATHDMILIEIKDFIDDKTERKNKNKWNATKEWVTKRGIKFLVLTNHQIRPPRMANIWFTLGSSKCHENALFFKKLKTHVSSCGIKGIKYNNLCFKLSQAFSISITMASQIIC